VTDGTTRYQRSRTVLWRRCPQSVLLLPRGAERPLALSGSGVDLWQMLEEPQTLEATANRLAKRFDVDATEVANSIEPVLDALVQARVVESLAR
jgi:hypothetical protein